MQPNPHPGRSTVAVLALFTLMAGSVSTVIASPSSDGGAAGATATGTPSAGAGIPRHNVPIAVVFRRDGEILRLVGSTPFPEPVVEPAAEERAPGLPGRAPVEATHEVYVLRDGAVDVYRFSAPSGLFSMLQEDAGGAAAWRPDPRGVMAAVVANAVNPAPQPSVAPVDVIGRASYGGPGRADLRGLCARSEVIAMGRVVGIVREAFTPVNGGGPQQHTVYAFAVYEYFKAAAPAGQPLLPVLKVHQPGGTLPFVFRAGDGREAVLRGFRIDGSPFMIIGAEYLLFLRKPSQRPVDRQHGYLVGGNGDHYGKIAELDEYVLTQPWRGSVLLRDGYTWGPDGQGAPSSAHVRPLGPEILGRPVADAVRLIRETVAGSPD